MYHALVRRRVRGLFDAVSHGNAEPVLEGFAPEFEHCFLGNTALGGTRRTLPAARRWYERLYRLLPDIRFDVRRIRVSGGPWNTLVLIEWDEANPAPTAFERTTAGSIWRASNWGRMTQLVICPDTVGLKATLDRLSLAGVAEAGAPPITD